MTLDQIREILDVARLSILSALLVIVVYTDVKRGKVYNWCTIGGTIVALGLALMYNDLPLRNLGPNFNLWISLQGLGAGFGVMFIFFLTGGIKFADVKLMAMVGAFMGYPAIWLAVIMSALAGALVAIAVLIWKGKLQDGCFRAGRMLLSWKAPKVPESKDDQEAQGFIMIPYGFAIAVGTLAALLFGNLGFLL